MLQFNKELIPASSLTHASEILFVLENCKPAARLLVNDFSLLKEFCQRHNLHIKEADHKLQLNEESDKGYSNKGVKVSKQEKGKSIIYISKHNKLAINAKIAEDNMDHIILGTLLGYPSCCVNFFSQQYEKESKKLNDFTLAALENSVNPFSFQTNICMRFFDHSLLSHFPCSFNCKNSIVLANKYLSAIKKENKEFAESIKIQLQRPVIYSETQGVHALLNSSKKNTAFSYSGVLSTSETGLSLKLKQGNRIKNTQIFKDQEMLGSIQGNILEFK